MTKVPAYWNKAKKYLSKKDKIMSSLIKKYKSPSETVLTSRKDVFFSLCKSIIGQQISVAAADSVFKKFNKLCRNKIRPITIQKISLQKLRKCGLSRQKAKGIKELSSKFLSKSFNPNLIKNMSDEEAIIYLSSLRQIGRWSAEMILIFTFNRPDVWPTQDIGLLRAISKNYKTNYPPSKKFLEKISKKHLGYRSVFTWYMWRSIDPVDVEY